VCAELDWTIARAVEHLGEARATRYLRKFYPWYVARLELDPQQAKRLQAGVQQSETIAEAQALFAASQTPLELAV
jgi:tRNA-dihydrouridine synthase B